jgi:hypothetical protein
VSVNATEGADSSPSSDASPRSYATMRGYTAKSSNAAWVTTLARTATPSTGRTGSVVPVRVQVKTEQASSSLAAGTRAIGSRSQSGRPFRAMFRHSDL